MYTAPLPPSPRGRAQYVMRISPMRVAAAVGWAVYIPYVFLLPPPAPAALGPSVLEAGALSFNFAFISPLVFQFAPVVHPALEALFNVVAAWALLLFGFASESESGKQRIPFLPIAIGTAFLTNIFYLPFLFLRSQNDKPVDAPKAPSLPLRIAESHGLPSTMLALLIASAVWGAVGRPEFGDIAQRVLDLKRIVETDVLAHSLALDTLYFSIFQSALVDDDVARRQWTGQQMTNAVRAARFVPFLGLVYYLWQRATHASLIAK